ncbi:MAG: hypothetical protein C4527_10695 [Candidatus Omnitrophota bacterium]|nr:MAG: hypothetical protein C4527_10695 [Candidatus Omnitrophota bacterium]
MNESIVNVQKIAELRGIFRKTLPLIKQTYNELKNPPTFPIIRAEKIKFVALSEFKVLREKWVEERKKKIRILKDYIPTHQEEQCLLDVERLQWTAQKITDLLITFNQMTPADKEESLNNLAMEKKKVRDAAALLVEVYYQLEKIKAGNPDIDQIERAKTSIANALKTSDKRALQELKIQYGALLAKEPLYSRRLTPLRETIYEEEGKLFAAYWNMESVLYGLQDKYSQYLFLTLQRVQDFLSNPKGMNLLRELIVENEEIQRQACILHDRAGKCYDSRQENTRMLHENSDNMGVILSQQNAMIEFMQKAVCDSLGLMEAGNKSVLNSFVNFDWKLN